VRSFSLSRRTLLGAGLAVLAAILVIAVTRPTASTSVLVTSRDLGAGVPIPPEALGLRNVDDPTGLVEATDVAAYAGWSLAAPLAGGEPVPRSLLRIGARQMHPDVVALTLSEDHAVLGVLVPGDFVDIYVTETTDDGTSTRLAAGAVYVVDVIESGDEFGSTRSARLLLAADEELARRVISARHAGDLDLVRVAR